MSAITSSANRDVRTSYFMATERTVPISVPSISTIAPAASPRKPAPNNMRTRTGAPSGRASAARLSLNNAKRWPAGAAAALPAPGAVAKAMPPTTSEAIDSVLTLSPLALTLTSMPPAFQKRVCVVTRASLGASIRTCTSSTSRRGSRA